VIKVESCQKSHQILNVFRLLAEALSRIKSSEGQHLTWSHKWQLYISSKNVICGSIDGPDVSIDGSVICKAHCVRDLAVLVDPQLKFMAHINSVVSRARGVYPPTTSSSRCCPLRCRSQSTRPCHRSPDRTPLAACTLSYYVQTVYPHAWSGIWSRSGVLI